MRSRSTTHQSNALVQRHCTPKATQIANKTQLLNQQQRKHRNLSTLANSRSVIMAATAAPSVDTLKACKLACEELIKAENCGPVLIRLAWHDSGNFDKDTGNGGANGSIRFAKELAHGGNAGLGLAIELLTPIKEKFPEVGFADLFQMASAAAVEVTGGPKIPMRYGRVDAESDAAVPIEGRLPSGAAPFQKADGPAPADDAEDQTPQHHLRRVFYRMGFNDQEIVALSGAHTLGRAHKDRSGLVTKTETIYTKDGPGRTKGGMSWTKEWLKFDNSYFLLLKQALEGKADPELLRLVTDTSVFEDEGFKPFAEKYAADESAFFSDYAVAHGKLSELGSTFSPPEGITI